MVLEFLTGLGIFSVVVVGAALAFLVAHILALIDSIRDSNWMWLLILLLFPGLGTIIYWIFGNKK